MSASGTPGPLVFKKLWSAIAAIMTDTMSGLGVKSGSKLVANFKVSADDNIFCVRFVL